MLNILLLICQTLYNFLTSEYIGTFVSLILLFHLILFNFIQDLHIVLSDGILYIFICFLFFFFQQLYSGLQFGHVYFLLLAYLTSLHYRVKILRLLTHLPQREITLFVQIHALFADAPDFHGGWIVLLWSVIQEVFHKGHLFLTVVIVVLSCGGLVVVGNMDLRHGVFIQNHFLVWVVNAMEDFAGERLSLSVAVVWLFSSTGWYALRLQPLLIINIHDAVSIHLHVSIGFDMISKSLIWCLMPHLLRPYGQTIL